MRFDDAKFLAKYAPDAHALRHLLEAYGFPVPEADTASKWYRRGAIPGAWLPTLLGVLELEHGGPISVLPFLTR